MIPFLLTIVGVGVYEIRKMAKNKQKKEIIVWICMAVLTIAFGVYFYSDANTTSLVAILFKLLNIEY